MEVDKWKEKMNGKDLSQNSCENFELGEIQI